MMNGQTLKILGIIQLLFSAAIFVLLGDSEKLNIGDETTFKTGVYTDKDLGGNSTINVVSSKSVEASVGTAYEHAFSGVYFETTDNELFSIEEGKQLNFLVSSSKPSTVNLIFDKRLKGTEKRPFNYVSEIQLDSSLNELTLSLEDFKTPEWWFEEHPNAKKDELISDSLISFNIELKKVNDESGVTVIQWDNITLSSGQNDAVMAIGGVTLLLGLILVFFPQKKTPVQAGEKHENPIVYYINSNLTSRSLTVNSVSEHFKLSTDYINDRVKTETGLSYKDYVNQKRIEKAKELLKSSDDKAFEIAQLCGFNSSASFSQTFKAVTGMTPNDFRKS